MDLQSHVNFVLNASISDLQERCDTSKLSQLRKLVNSACSDTIKIEKTKKFFAKIDKNKTHLEQWALQTVDNIIHKNLPECEDILITDLESCTKTVTWESKARYTIGCKHVYERYIARLSELSGIKVQQFCRDLHSTKWKVVENSYYFAKTYLPLEEAFGHGCWVILAPFGPSFPKDVPGMKSEIEEREWLLDLIRSKSAEVQSRLERYKEFLRYRLAAKNHHDQISQEQTASGYYQPPYNEQSTQQMAPISEAGPPRPSSAAQLSANHTAAYVETAQRSKKQKGRQPNTKRRTRTGLRHPQSNRRRNGVMDEEHQQYHAQPPTILSQLHERDTFNTEDPSLDGNAQNSAANTRSSGTTHGESFNGSASSVQGAFVNETVSAIDLDHFMAHGSTYGETLGVNGPNHQGTAPLNLDHFMARGSIYGEPPEVRGPNHQETVPLNLDHFAMRGFGPNQSFSNINLDHSSADASMMAFNFGLSPFLDLR